MSQDKKEISSLGYAHLPAYDSGHLPVSDIHTLWYEQYGKQDGKPGKAFAHKSSKNFMSSATAP
jgi:hypothetical protein